MGKEYSGLQTFGILFGVLLLIGGLGGYLWADNMDGKATVVNGMPGHIVVSPTLFAICIIAMVLGALFLVAGLVNKSEGDEPKPVVDVTHKEPERFYQNKFCPQCGIVTEQYYLRCPRCAWLLRKDCPGCNTRLPVEYAACPTCGFIFITEKPAKEKVIPIKAVAVGRCPRCTKVLLEGQDVCQNCGWIVDKRDLGLV